VKYFDFNAGAPLRPQVRAVLEKAFADGVGNPSSVHQVGRAARRVLREARERIGYAVGASHRDVVFTGSGSEAAALAIKGAWARRESGRNRVVVSAIEHPCVLGAVKALPNAVVTRVPPETNGAVSEAAFGAALATDVALASLMWVNNETGVVQPVPAIARRCDALGIAFHSDAVQAFGRVELACRLAPGAMLSFAGHKLGTPAGIGVLVAERWKALEPLVQGHQEDGRRGGTENVPYAMALAEAMTLAASEREAESMRLRGLRDGLEAKLPMAKVNGVSAERVANTTNLHFPGVSAEALLMALDLEGFCVSTGAACASGSVTPSHVLLAMGLSVDASKQCLRVSMGPSTTDAEVDALGEALGRHVVLMAERQG
jgi:cysteine desulfurase